MSLIEQLEIAQYTIMELKETIKQLAPLEAKVQVLEYRIAQLNKIIDNQNKQLQLLGQDNGSRISAQPSKLNYSQTSNPQKSLLQSSIQFTQQDGYGKSSLVSLRSHKSESNGSILVTQQLECSSCRQSGAIIILSCSHRYHSQCLEKILNNCINQQMLAFECICKERIRTQTVMKFSSSMDMVIKKLYQIQLRKIDQQIRGWHCPNYNCEYFCIRSEKAIKAFCPLCLCYYY